MPTTQSVSRSRILLPDEKDRARGHRSTRWRFLVVLVLAAAVGWPVVPAGAEDDAPHDGGPPPAATPVEEAPASPLAAVTHDGFRDAVFRHLQAQGFTPLVDEEEQRRLADWFVSRELEQWTRIRNASYRLLEYRFAEDDSGRSTEVPQLHVTRVMARFDPARHLTTHAAVLHFHVATRQEGYPPTATDGRLLDYRLARFAALDGRRVLTGEYPTRTGRAPSEGERAWMEFAGGSQTPGGIATLKTEFGPPLEEHDVLLINPLIEETSAEAAVSAQTEAHFASYHPLIKFYSSRGAPYAGTPRRLMREATDHEDVSWWRDEASILVFVAGREGRRVVRDVEYFPPPSGYILRFEAGTGLLSEISMGILREGELSGQIESFELADVRTAEGAILRLPVSHIELRSPDELFIAALEAPEEWVAHEPVERSTFVCYDLLNDPSLHAPDLYDFDAYARRLGLRLHPSARRQSDRTFGPKAVVFGPERNDPSFLARWDEVVRQTVVESGVPVAPEEMLRFEEIAARGTTRDWLHTKYVWNEDGTVTVLPRPRLREPGQPATAGR